MDAPDWLVRLGLLIDLASGVVFLLLGILVALVRPHRTLNNAFAGFSCAMGIAYVAANLGPDYLDVAGPWIMVVYLAAIDAAIGCLLVVAIEFPGELPPGNRRPFVLPGLVSIGALIVQAVVLRMFIARHGLLTFSGLSTHWFVFGLLSFFTFLGAVPFLLMVLAQRVPGFRGPLAPKSRRQAALISMALLPYAALASAGHTMTTLLGFHDLVSLGYGVLIVICWILGGLWFRNAAPAAPGERGLFHAVALACFALPLVGTLFVLLTPDWNNIGVLGLSRLAGVAVLAYAILRQQLFDIDVRLKWTIRRGALASVFVAVFFVVSEGVQNWVGHLYGALTGIAAAGLLVFAMAPLQRLADRVANATMPSVHEHDPAYLESQRRETYRNAVALVWSDGHMTAKEMQMLLKLREALRLSAQEAHRLERESGYGAAPVSFD